MCTILGIERDYVGEKRYIPTCTSLSTSIHYQYTNGYTTEHVEVTLASGLDQFTQIIEDNRRERRTRNERTTQEIRQRLIVHQLNHQRTNGYTGEKQLVKGEIPSRVSISKLGWDLVLTSLTVLAPLQYPHSYPILIPIIHPILPLVIPLDSIRFHQYLLEILLIVLIKTLIDDQHSL